MTSQASPRTLRGFRDLLPAEMLLRNEIVDRIRRVYESFGYLPVDTPVLESLPTLVGSGGEETDSQIFRLLTPERREAGLRFDLTVPFARVVAQYPSPQIRLPFRRYQIGPVFRADDPQPEQGRLRQFLQFDVDIAGTTSIAADAEIITVVDAALRAVGLAPATVDGCGYGIRVNSRRLVDAYLSGLGIDGARAVQVLRALDKRDRIGDAGLAAELGSGRRDRSGDWIAGVGLDPGTVTALLGYAAVTGATRAETVEQVLALTRPGELAERASTEVRELLAQLDALGIGESAVRFDPSLARGLAYYTGTVFEAVLVPRVAGPSSAATTGGATTSGATTGGATTGGATTGGATTGSAETDGGWSGSGVGSVLGGGRYDGLIGRFRSDPVPAVGAAIGVDRLLAGMCNLGLAPAGRRDGARVIVLAMPGVPSPVFAQLARELRAGGIATLLSVVDAEAGVRKQLAYANAEDLRVAVILGRDEYAAGTVTVKDLGRGLAERRGLADNRDFRTVRAGQTTVARAQLVSEVSRVLGIGSPS